MLDGFIGPTKKSDRMRLYLNLSFDTFVDIPVSGIMSTLPIDASDENSPTRVWIRAETRLDVVQSMSRTIEASYLRGGIARQCLTRSAAARRVANVNDLAPDAKSLALLGDDRLKCTEEQLVEALTGRSHPLHRRMLAFELERLRLLDEQIAKLNSLIAQAMKTHQDAVIQLAQVSGLGIDSAQQIIAEVGVTASTFSSAAEFTSWVGTGPGKEESAEENHNSGSAKGNKYLRRVLNQAAHAAARSKGTHFQAVFRRLLPRLGYQSAVWAIAHRLCRLVWKILHEGIRYIEQGIESEPKLLIHRAQYLARQLRRFGYNVQITPDNRAPA